MLPDRLLTLSLEIAKRALRLPYGFWNALTFPVSYTTEACGGELQVEIQLDGRTPSELRLSFSIDDGQYPKANAPVHIGVTIANDRRDADIRSLSFIDYQPTEEDYADTLAIIMYGSDRVARLLPYGLQDSSQETRAFAAWLLGLSGDEAAVPLLKPLLKDSGDIVRWRSAEALLRLGSWDDHVLAAMGELKDSQEIQGLYPEVREDERSEVLQLADVEKVIAAAGGALRKPGDRHGQK